MKKIVFTLSMALMSLFAYSQTTYTKGYIKPSSGVYVAPYEKTQSNGTNLDNFSTKGNSNPYTGDAGTKARDFSPEAKNYGGGQEVHTGPRGGTYIINSSGNKTYLPKRN
jgi:hypothetical protein